MINNYLVTSLLLLLQLEFFFFLCYDYVLFSLKSLKISSTKKAQEIGGYFNYNKYVLLLLLGLLIFTKSMTTVSILLLILVTLIFTLLCSLLKTSYFFQKTAKSSMQLVLPTFIFFLFFLDLVESFLSFFFYIEVYGVLYYFIFLSSYVFTNQTLLKYKNNILLVLWNNFLTTVFLTLSCFYLFKYQGTTQFVELSFTLCKNYPLYFFLVGLCWKLGLPLFHFFKLEVYKYLTRENIFVFSVVTACLNVVILFFCLGITSMYSILYSNNLIVIILLFCISLVLSSLKLQNILSFFAISSVITVTTITALFVI